MSAFTGWVNRMCHGNFSCNAWINIIELMVYHLNYIDIHFGEMFIKRFIWYSGMNKILSVPRATKLSPSHSFGTNICNLHCNYCVQLLGILSMDILRCEWREWKTKILNMVNVRVFKAINLTWISHAINICSCLCRLSSCTRFWCVCVCECHHTKPAQPTTGRKTNLQTKLIFYIQIHIYVFLIRSWSVMHCEYLWACFNRAMLLYPMYISCSLQIWKLNKQENATWIYKHMYTLKLQLNTICESNYWFYCFAVVFVVFAVV